MLTLVFCLGAALFYVLLYRSRIVPRWITLWGFVGIPLYAAAYLLAMYGAIGGNSSAQNLLQLPLAVQEMVLAVWMIARGFRPATASTTPAPVSDTLAGAIHPWPTPTSEDESDRSRDRAEDNVRRRRT